MRSPVSFASERRQQEVAAIAVTSDAKARQWLIAASALLGSRLHFAADWTEARCLLRQKRISVLIVDVDTGLGPQSWHEVLSELSRWSVPPPPNVIALSRDADPCMWAECLNLGGYDVLPKPLDLGEVLRTAHLADSDWSRNRCTRSAGAF